MPRIHILGASGSGTSTLGQAVAACLDCPQHDTDDFLWVASDPPYQRTRPMPDRLHLLHGALVRSHGEAFRVQAGDAAAGEDSWVLWQLYLGSWRRLYSFEHVSLDCPRVHAADFLLCSHFVQYAPGTLFLTTRYATRPSPGGRIMLIKHDLRETGPEAEGSAPEVRVTRLNDAAEYAAAAQKHLGIRLTEAEARALFEADVEKAPA